MPALASFLIENDGSYSDKTIEHYRLRAAGGPAMIIMEAHGVSQDGIVSNHQARIYDDRFINDLSKAAAVIKKEGSIPAIQIHHAGRQVPFRVINRKPFAPSNLPCPAIQGAVEPLCLKDIKRIIRQFGDAAERAVKAGFELIEIHGAHGYLINQFLSGFSNVREDQYGLNVRGRTRFASEIVAEIRSRIGAEFPLSFKISAQEFVPDGLTTDESIVILKQLEKDGIDIVQVSAGNDATPEWICQPMFMKQACLVDSAARIKVALKIPVMVVGRINDPFIADEILDQGKADLVCIGRGLLADPELPKKALAGNYEDIRICIACNTCMQSIFRKGRIECLVNPSLGREKEMSINPTEHPKKIMVIGGGPGGLNASRIAAMRGHHVSLYEKAPELGGQLISGSAAPHKKELHNLINFLTGQIKKHHVDIRLSTTVSIDIIKQNKPDAVIIATGSTPFIPQVAGIESNIVCTSKDFFNGKLSNIKKAVVIGGGATGCEIALNLSEKGCNVTLVEKLPKIGIQIEAITRKMIIQSLKRNNVKMLTNFKLSKISDNGAFVDDGDGNSFFLEGDRVIITIGNKPNNELYAEMLNLGIETYHLGDCVEVRSAKEAIYEGAMIGKMI